MVALAASASDLCTTSRSLQDQQNAAPDDSFQVLVEKLVNLHNQEVQELRAEIKQFQSAVEVNVGSQASDLHQAAMESEAPPPDDPIFDEHTDMSSVKGVRFDMPCEAEPSKGVLHPLAQMHEIWERSNHIMMANWSSQFDTVLRIQAIEPKLSVYSKFSYESAAGGSTSMFNLCGILPLLPSSRFKALWDLISMLALLYDVSFIPMQVFDMPDGDTSFVGILDWFCVAFWTLDLPLNFLVAYYKKDGHAVTSLYKIAVRYAKGWLFLDLLIISTDWLTVAMRFAGKGDAVGGGAGLARLGKIMRVARSLRTLRLLRLMKLRELMSFFYDVIESEWMSLILGTSINLISLIAVNHGIACLWFWLGSATSPRITWVQKYGFTSASWSEQYVASLQWSLTQFTAASTPVTATNPEERVFSVLVILFAIVAFSSFLSAITSAMTRLRSMKSHHLSQTLLLNKFLKQNHISRDLKARIIRYVQLILSQHEEYLDSRKVEYLSLISGPLSVELHWERYARVLKPHPFFQKCYALGQSAMQQLCFTAVSSLFLAKEDVLFDWGADCKKMYFPRNGFLFYRRPPGFKSTPRYIMVHRGQWFCENGLWTPWMHVGLMKALIDLTLVAIDVNGFHRTARAHPEVFSLGIYHAQDFLDVMNNPDQWRPYTWDVPWDVMYPATKRRGVRQSCDTLGNVVVANAETLATFEKEAQLVDFLYGQHEDNEDEVLDHTDIS